MALASCSQPTHPKAFRKLIRVDGHGGFITEELEWPSFAPAAQGDRSNSAQHANRATTMQCRLEEVMLELADRIPAATHVDGTARIQTIVHNTDPLLHELITGFYAITGIPVVINTSFNTAGRPMVDHPRDALECFGSAAIDALVLGPFLVRRNSFFEGASS